MKNIYTWEEYDSTKTPRFPPHLKDIPPKDKDCPLAIFDPLGLAEASHIINKFLSIQWPDKAWSWVLERINGKNPDANAGPKIADFETYNKKHRKRGTDLAQGDNLGHLDDWYSDRRFAEQSFTGTNPVTIEKVHVLSDLFQEFKDAAELQERHDILDRFASASSEGSSFFVQDCRYFRTVLKDHENDLSYAFDENTDQNWACASVTLFELDKDGKLHPLAIVLDYKKTMEKSVTVFNKHVRPLVPTTKAKAIPEQRDDWPWRYAKTCAQVSDWIRHEIGVHLTQAHFIEEALIVATNRTIDENHIIFRLLQPHWKKTLSLNAAARKALVPKVIQRLTGLTENQLYTLINHEFESFNYQQNYVPENLKRRGFPSHDIITKEPTSSDNGLDEDMYKNYAYAKNALSMWNCIHKYVESMLEIGYRHFSDKEKRDKQVEEDTEQWCKEIQKQGKISSFPTIKTLEELCSAITMAIYIASPFHSAVNYLQNFYQAFVPAKPPCLSQKLPESINDLQEENFKEDNYMKALPIGRQYQWLLATQLPWLLSFRASGGSTLISLAKASQRVNWGGDREQKRLFQTTCRKFYEDLRQLDDKFVETTDKMDIGRITYNVMKPSVAARSILI